MDFYDEILNSDVIALDTETTGKYWPRDRAFGVSLSTRWNDYYWDTRQSRSFIDPLRHAIEERRPVISAHNASFDYKMLKSMGLTTDLRLWQCTVVRACLINEHEGTIFPWTRTRGNYSLDSLGNKYLDIRKDQQFYEDARAFFGKPKVSESWIMARIAELPVDMVSRYAKQDTRVTYELWYWQQQEICRQGIQDIVAFEQRVFPVLVRSEMRGVHVDCEAAERARPKLTKIIDQKQKELNEIAGWDFNVNSSPQIRKLLKPYTDDGSWFAGDGTPLESTKAGNPCLDAKVLPKINHPAVPYIQDIRSLVKTRDTFLGGHILGHNIRGVVYPNINQAKGEDGGTGTGRLSYTQPALQQIPARNRAVAEIVKPCFLPPPGMVWCETDLASFEVRVFAHLVAGYNDALVHAYEQNPALDFHQYVADETGLPRDRTRSGEPYAKALNLAMIFNQGNGSTAETMGMPWTWEEFSPSGYNSSKVGDVIRYKRAGPEAMEIINRYHLRVPGVKTLANRAKMIAEQREQIRTAMNRRLRFPRGYKSYAASGILIQATAADWNKRNWLIVDEVLGDNGHLILNTHDSYSMALPEDWRPYYERVKEAIEDTTDIKCRVPLILDLDGAGKNWWSAKCGEMK